MDIPGFPRQFEGAGSAGIESWNLKKYPSAYLSLERRQVMITDMYTRIGPENFFCDTKIENLEWHAPQHSFLLRAKSTALPEHPAGASAALETREIRARSVVVAGGRFWPLLNSAPLQSHFKRFEFGVRVEVSSSNAFFTRHMHTLVDPKLTRRLNIDGSEFDRTRLLLLSPRSLSGLNSAPSAAVAPASFAKRSPAGCVRSRGGPTWRPPAVATSASTRAASTPRTPPACRPLSWPAYALSHPSRGLAHLGSTRTPCEPCTATRRGARWRPACKRYSRLSQRCWRTSCCCNSDPDNTNNHGTRTRWGPTLEGVGRYPVVDNRLQASLSPSLRHSVVLSETDPASASTQNLSARLAGRDEEDSLKRAGVAGPVFVAGDACGQFRGITAALVRARG